MNMLNEVMKMDIGELRTFKMIVDKLIQTKSAVIINELQVGDTVKVNHRKVTGLTFTVVKINRKKIRVKQANSGITYNVAMSLIEKI
jgi:sRNA-binding protein